MEPPAPKAQAVSLVSCDEKIFVRSGVLECYSAALLQNAILFTIPCPARFVNTFILYYYGRTALDGCRRHAVQWMLYPRCGSAPRPGGFRKERRFMPLIIPQTLPAYKALEEENVFVMHGPAP